MNNHMSQKTLKRIIRWLLLAIVIAYGLSGFGITEFRIVESLTFGLLTKNLAFKIHDILWIPFLVLLTLHIYLSYIIKLKKLKMFEVSRS